MFKSKLRKCRATTSNLCLISRIWTPTNLSKVDFKSLVERKLSCRFNKKTSQMRMSSHRTPGPPTPVEHRDPWPQISPLIVEHICIKFLSYALLKNRVESSQTTMKSRSSWEKVLTVKSADASVRFPS